MKMPSARRETLLYDTAETSACVSDAVWRRHRSCPFRSRRRIAKIR